MARKPVGGYAQPIQLSIFIRDYLADGRETWGFDVYRAYREAVDATPYSGRKLHKRKRADGSTYTKSGRGCISYSGFRSYLFYARKAGLIEYVTNPDGTIKEEPAVDKAGNFAPHLAPTKFLRAVPSRINDPGWSNLRRAAGYT
jgi:hypothetical protein